MPRDAPWSGDDAEAMVREPDWLCAHCRHGVTKGRWAISAKGAHEHVVFNPAGVVFRVVCFKEAPGLEAVGEASGVFTWFPGYAWRIGLCRGCGTHLGWRYEGEGSPAIFFGLIKGALVCE